MKTNPTAFFLHFEALFTYNGASKGKLMINRYTRLSFSVKHLSIILILAFCVGSAYADDLLYRYEGDVLPDDPSAGWLWGGCDGACSTSLQDGHFVLTWQNGADLVNYTRVISNDAGEPPPRKHSGWSGTSVRIRC